MGFFTEPDQPLVFLNSSVLSFSAQLGLGNASESSLQIELVDDCKYNQQFLPFNGSVIVGDGVYFPDSSPTGFNYSFGGVLQSWTYNQGRSGRTYSCTITDPRQLLENAVVIVDSYLGDGYDNVFIPELSVNYFNVYGYLERQFTGPNACSAYGNSESTERGMPYYKIMQALLSINNPQVVSPTGFSFAIDFYTFPDLNSVPRYYRVPGPSVTLLQLLQDLCDVLGLEFYCWMDSSYVIKIGYVNLNQPAYLNTGYYLSQYKDGGSTSLSYGQELRNDKTRTMVMGDSVHYLTGSADFYYFFGEDLYPDGMYYPVVPLPGQSNPLDGFFISKRLQDLNHTLYRPLFSFIGADFFVISEMDIRCAMASYDLWLARVMTQGIGIQGSLNYAIREVYSGQSTGIDLVFDVSSGPLDVPVNFHWRNFLNQVNSPGPTTGTYDNIQEKDLQAIHGYVKNLGDSYYGKQWVCSLAGNICARLGENFQEIIYTDVPTNAGGWIDDGQGVFNLYDPDLGLFRQTDGRVGAFVGYAP